MEHDMLLILRGVRTDGIFGGGGGGGKAPFMCCSCTNNALLFSSDALFRVYCLF